MRNHDIPTREELRVQLQQAIRDNNSEAFSEVFNQLVDRIGADIRDDYEQQLNDLRQEMDTTILTARGVRQLTSDETKYYQKVIAAMQSRNPKQALTDVDLTMPETVINSVFDDLRTNHPLLSAINFIPTNGAVSMIMNTNGYQEAAWGALCDDIVKELTGGFKEVNTTLLKLSAFLPVCKAMLDLGPAWLDRYVREVLLEALANGLEAGFVNGDGNGKPIGMTRQVGDDVSVTGGTYPKKDAKAITALDPATVGGLIATLAAAPTGKQRPVRNVIFVCNPVDYFQRVMPATTLMAPDGTYRNDVMPYPMTIIQSPAVEVGQAVIGLGKLYFAAAGAEKGGRIEFSDQYRFLEDERVYLIKTYANGMPMDNNAFILLDISGLEPALLRVQTVAAE